MNVLPISLSKDKLSITKTEDYSQEWFEKQEDLKNLFPGGFQEF